MECKHQFEDKYDEEEVLSDEVIDMAENYSSSDDVEQILNAGKCKKRTYVLSYCRICGVAIDRTKGE